MRSLLIALTFIAWTLVVLIGLFGFASIFLAIWQQSEQWGSTGFFCIVLTMFGGLGATGLTWIAGEKS